MFEVWGGYKGSGFNDLGLKGSWLTSEPLQKVKLLASLLQFI